VRWEGGRKDDESKTQRRSVFYGVQQALILPVFERPHQAQVSFGLKTRAAFSYYERPIFEEENEMAGDNMLTMTDDNFSELVEKNAGPILVDFWAEWCMPCRALAPVIDELSNEFKGKVRFAKLNVDECREVPSKFGIRGIPTLILFKDGKKVNELVGNQPKDKIRMMLASS
jgi:thioredoxin 1